MNPSSLSFIWPHHLWALLLLPPLIVGYVWLLKRRKNDAVIWSSLSLVKVAQGSKSRWQRHVPPALLCLALGLLIVAASRPTAVVTLPSHTLAVPVITTGSGLTVTDAVRRQPVPNV